jgi:predicted transposase YdaD
LLREITEILYRKVYEGYNEFEEDGMNASTLFSDLRIIEQLHQELDEERRVREEAVSKAELDRQRLRDTARNILRLGLSVEQVAQATGLPPETVRTLTSRP